VLQGVAAYCSVLQRDSEPYNCGLLLNILDLEIASVLQCVAVCCSVVHCGAVWCSMLQCVAVCCSVTQRSTIEGIAMSWSGTTLDWVIVYARIPSLTSTDEISHKSAQ